MKLRHSFFLKTLLCAAFLSSALPARTANPPSTLVLRQNADRTSVLSQKGTDFGFFMPETGGYWKPGLMMGSESVWLKDCKDLNFKKVNRGWELVVRDPLLGKATLTMQVQPLTDCNGMIVKIVGTSLPKELQFVWVYGGCNADSFPQDKTDFLRPEQCRNNVFSREINAFTVYYGRTERLKVMMGVAPLNTTTRLADAKSMSTPVACWNSGKKTDTPVMIATNPLISGDACYYCIYRQNQKADYNYYMLSALFEKESKQQSTQTNEKAKPHTDFGPDFHQQ